ncbi:unnamed protein product [Agarophyton chilense]
MVTVGVLAALINIITLIVVAIADRAIELIVRNFATSRLITHRRAPVVHDSDTWLPYLPRSVVKYYKNPAILCTVLCTGLLVTAELVSEFGVDVSKTCKPVAQEGSVIAPGRITNSFTDIELSGTCFLLQTIKFDEGPLQRIRAGIPRRLTGRECFKCLDPIDNPEILSGCKIPLVKQYKAGELEITTRTTNETFKTLTDSFRDIAANKTYWGCGDFTHNGNASSTFLIHKHRDRRRLLYFEYNDQEHLNFIKGMVPSLKGEPLTQPTEGPAYVFEISCKVNVLNITTLANVVRMYRTIQLENPITPADLNAETNLFDVLTPDAIYRAVLAGKIIDDIHNRESGSFQMPFNSRSWYLHARKLEATSTSQPEYKKRKRGYFVNIFEELRLEDDEIHPNGRLVVVPGYMAQTPDTSDVIDTNHLQIPPLGLDSFQRNS